MDGSGRPLGSLVLSAVNTLLTSLTSIDDDNSFYEGVVEWLSRRQQLPGARAQGRGIVMLEIDGLSCQRMQRAIDEGWMPTARQMLATGRMACRASTAACPLKPPPARPASCTATTTISRLSAGTRKPPGACGVEQLGDAAELNARYSAARACCAADRASATSWPATPKRPADDEHAAGAPDEASSGARRTCTCSGSIPTSSPGRW